MRAILGLSNGESPASRLLHEKLAMTSDPLPEDTNTGLPGFRRWRTVYVVVLGIFLLWLGLLTWFTEAYS